MNGEVTVKSDLARIFAQQSAADRMECPRPGQGINHQTRLFRQDLRGDPLNPTDHLLRGSPGKGEEHDATRINAANNQMGHAMGERLCLSRTRPCIDEQRLNTVLHSTALFRVERNEMRIGHRFVDGMEVANRACRTGMVWCRRCALVAPCVGPVLTEPVSGAVPSHFAVLVAVAEDSRLIALWASAHCYESNPYRLSSCQSASPSPAAMPFAVMRQ